MPREPTIPIFLWITTAILLHILGYGGSERVVTHVEARRTLQEFVSDLVREARSGPRELEIALLDREAGPDDDAPEADDPPEDDPVPGRPPLIPAPAPPDLPEEDPDEPAPPDAEPRRAPEPTEKSTPEQKPPQELTLPPMDRRVAVVQHVEDPDQEDNPDARFMAEHANRVEQETRASITSLDRNDLDPTPGRAHEGPSSEPGDADDTRIAQSEDEPGADETKPEPASTAAVATVSEGASVPPAGGLPPPPAARPVPERAPPAVAIAPAPELLSSGEGAWDGWEGRSAQPAQSASPRRLPPPPARPGELFGYGRSGTTANGVNLNLSPSAAVAAVGAEQLAAERRQDGERRRSQHRGSNKPMGLERWRSAIENYVASVQPGNQTALNTARVPFARYLHEVHLKIHPVFADSFLRSLDSLPASDPLNRPQLQTHLELVLHPDDGHLVRMGVTRSSGVTAFDIGALESISTASPFGRAPSAIVSPDGNVYLHWEFHRQPWIACGTFNARPYILKAKPLPAEPRVPPPLRPEAPSRDERQGALELPVLRPPG